MNWIKKLFSRKKKEEKKSDVKPSNNIAEMENFVRAVNMYEKPYSFRQQDDEINHKRKEYKRENEPVKRQNDIVDDVINVATTAYIIDSLFDSSSNSSSSSSFDSSSSFNSSSSSSSDFGGGDFGGGGSGDSW